MTTATKPTTLASALVAAQAEFPEIPKDGKGVIRGKSKSGEFYEYEYTYATLPVIFRLTFPILHKYDLALTQTSGDGNLITALRHSSGEVLESHLEMPSPRQLSPQQYGAAHSYYRRYEANGMLGLAPDDDIDAAGVPEPTSPTHIRQDDPDLGDPPPGGVEETAARLVKENKDLIKNWWVGEPFKTEGDAMRAVADLVGEVMEDVMPKKGWDENVNLYKATRQRMNDILDKRTAEKE